MHLCRHVHNLVEAAGDEIHELHLGHRAHAHQRCPDGRTHNGRLGNGRVDHALLSEFLQHPGGDLERAAISTNVFSKQEHGRVAFHLLPDTLADSLKIS